MDWDVIPEIFYDLIARVFPGTLILVSGTIIVLGLDEAIIQISQFSAKANFLSLLLAIVISYFTGIFLHQAWLFIVPKVNFIYRKRREDIYQVVNNPKDQSRLVKIESEIVSAEVLIAGYSLLFFVNIFMYAKTGQLWSRSFFFFTLVVLIFFSYRFRQILILLVEEILTLYRSK